MQTETTSNELVTPLSPDGFVVGQSTTDKVAFYGVTPVVQPTSASQAAVTITATTALATATISAITATDGGVHGFSSSTVAGAYVARVKQMQVDIEAVGVLLNQLRGELVDLGLIAGS